MKQAAETVRISDPLEALRDHYPVVVVGSGYGGAIAASRLARAGQEVCLLERGRELQPGEYPDTDRQVRRETQYDFPKRHKGPKTGLYDFRFNGDIDVLVGCGLGGTSLINANVYLPPIRRVFEDEHWPSAIRNDPAAIDALLGEYYERAREMLDARPYPRRFPALRKLEAMEGSAAALKEAFPERPLDFYRIPIHVTFEDGVNHVGVYQEACKLCGDCVTGCNHRAKNTLLMNYLPDACNHGAEIFTRVQVNRVAREGDRWIVSFEPLGYGRGRFDAPEMFVGADLVVLSAGTLGSTGILFRSRDDGLPLSQRLGERFSANGDFFGFSYNGTSRVNAIGYGDRPLEGREPVGPCITCVMDMRHPDRIEGQIIEDGTAPGAYANWVFPLSLALASVPLGKDTDRGFVDFLREQWNQLVSLIFGAFRGADQNTQLFLSASYDDAAGKMYLRDDRVRITWPGAGDGPNYKELVGKMFETARTLGGIYIHNPLWNKLFGYDLITAHPLGGCSMGDDAARGVVNDRGQVFAGAEGTDVHEGLYVMDGAVVPRSLGINPLMTISALAERNVELLAEERGWTIDYTLPSRPAAPPRKQHVGVQFTERMAGHFSAQVPEDLPRYDDMPRYFEGERLGIEEGAGFDYVLTVLIDDMDAFLADPEHEARTIGTVRAPTLSKAPLTATGGTFNLFIPDPDRQHLQRLFYTMKLTSVEGQRYFFDGFKLMCRGRGNGPWADTSIMYFTLHAGHDPGGPVVGTGLVRMKFLVWLVQLRTTRANGTRTRFARFKQTMRFAWWFTRSMVKVYGWRIVFPGRKKKKWKPSYACH